LPQFTTSRNRQHDHSRASRQLAHTEYRKAALVKAAFLCFHLCNRNEAANDRHLLNKYYSPEQAHPPQAAGFGASVFGQYPVLNQPSPFRLKAVDEIIFSTAAPHSEHWLAGGSENFWRSSNW
jgi:hypothetical protein